MALTTAISDCSGASTSSLSGIPCNCHRWGRHRCGRQRVLGLMRWRDGIYGWAFNAAVELTEVMRQLGPEQAAFRDALLAVAEGRATRVHYDLFKTRMRSQLSDTELDSFLDAVHLFPTNQKAGDHNWTRLRGLGSPIALVKAEHTVAGSTNVSADRFRNLEPHSTWPLEHAFSLTATYGHRPG